VVRGALWKAPASVGTGANDDPCSRNAERNMWAAARLDSECTQGAAGVGAAIATRGLGWDALPMLATRRKYLDEALRQ
jgi:hypothetical protein